MRKSFVGGNTNMKILFVIVLSIISFCGCKDKHKGSPLGYVDAEPPVAANTPAGFKSSNQSMATQTNQNAIPELTMPALQQTTDPTIVSIKQTIFSANYPRMGDHTCRGVISCALKSIDSGMHELDRRNQEKARGCVTGTPQEQLLSIPLGFNTYNYSQKLQCSDQLSAPANFIGEQWLSFGKEGNKFYLDFQQSEGIMYLATVDVTTENVEAFVIEDGYKSYRLLSDKEHGIFELTADYLCGFHMKNNPDYAYIEMNSCSTTSPKTMYCLDTTYLNPVNISYCQALNLTTFSMSSIVSSELDRTALGAIAQDLSFIKSLPRF